MGREAVNAGERWGLHFGTPLLGLQANWQCQVFRLLRKDGGGQILPQWDEIVHRVAWTRAIKGLKTTSNCICKQAGILCNLWTRSIIWSILRAPKIAHAAALCSSRSFWMNFRGWPIVVVQVRDDLDLSDWVQGSRARKDHSWCTKESCAKALLATSATCSLSRRHGSRRIPKFWTGSEQGNATPFRNKDNENLDLEAPCTQFCQGSEKAYCSPSRPLQLPSTVTG